MKDTDKDERASEEKVQHTNEETELNTKEEEDCENVKLEKNVESKK